MKVEFGRFHKIHFVFQFAVGLESLLAIGGFTTIILCIVSAVYCCKITVSAGLGGFCGDCCGGFCGSCCADEVHATITCIVVKIKHLLIILFCFLIGWKFSNILLIFRNQCNKNCW